MNGLVEGYRDGTEQHGHTRGRNMTVAFFWRESMRHMNRVRDD